MNCEIERFDALTDTSLQLVAKLELEVFENPICKEDLERRLSGVHRLLILIARVGGVACGFKVGYEYASDTDYFYSWIGGVSPNYRRSGIASRLMLEQHRIAKVLGFKYVQTKTKNKYREMLLLNIKHGFDVTGVYQKLKEEKHGIILEKQL